jgi:hypothetical protein
MGRSCVIDRGKIDCGTIMCDWSLYDHVIDHGKIYVIDCGTIYVIDRGTIMW